MIWLFYFHLVAVLSLGTFYIGGASLRVYSTLIMTILVLITGNSLSFYKDKYICLYVAFQLAMMLALSINGELTEYGFFKKFLAYHYVGIVTYYAIQRFVISERVLWYSMIVLLLLVSVDAVISILQYYGNSTAWSIGVLLGDDSDKMERLDVFDTMLGVSAVPGVFQNVVKNAYQLAVFAPIACLLVEQKRSVLMRLFAICAIVLIIYASFVTQQRAAFGLVLICMFVFLVRLSVKHKVRGRLAVLLVIVIGLILADHIQADDMGRLIETGNDTREVLKEQAVSFIDDNWAFGAPMRFQRIAGLSAHNFIYDTIIFSGILGFLIMMVLTITMAYNSLHNIRKSFSNYAPLFYVSLMVVVALIYGLFHNTSLLTGEVAIIIVLAYMVRLHHMKM